MKKILIIDNYDSFVFNIIQLVREVENAPEFEVFRNDNIPFDKLDMYNGIILSPGPGIPDEAGSLLSLIECCKQTHPILGICLGHQAIAQSFGASLQNMRSPLHGHRTVLTVTDPADRLLQGMISPITVGRYHSWVVDAATIPADLQVSSLDEDGNIMSFYHRCLPIHGVQFHPESYMSDYGALLVKNWLEFCIFATENRGYEFSDNN